MAKIDLKKQLKQLYFPSAKAPSIVDVPSIHFLMIDGTGDPNTSQAFQEAIGALYGCSYTLKFMLKKQGTSPDYTVQTLEGLWWNDEAGGLNMDDKATWMWTLMMAQPDFITPEMFEEARKQLSAKKQQPGLDKVRFERFHEGLSVQIMHVGPYSEERPNIERLHAFAHENGYVLRGKHHEIYLSDPRRTKPERLRTVLRQPVARP